MDLRLHVVVSVVALSVSGLTFAQVQKSRAAELFPDQIIIGSNSFIDIGPPFDYYTVYVLKAQAEGTTVERLSVSPHGDACLQPATVEVATRQTNQSLSDLLEGKNPCSIPEKALHREIKRCKHCAVFSGANVAMQIQCGPVSRILKAEILDRDIFASYPNTPQYTAGTYKLLNALDHLFGSSALDKPIFPVDDPAPSSKVQDAAISDLAAGKFDMLFPAGGQTVSAIYAEAQMPHRPPAVSVAEVAPITASEAKPPAYPPIARVAHLQGTVHLNITIGGDGKDNQVSQIDGQLMLATAAATAAKAWKFDPKFAGQTTQGTVEYNLNCSTTTK
jgi:protein TonB